MEPTKIRPLSQDIVHRIAAGEVVEGPNSVIKELVENSVDAGATKICVKIVAGGLELIDVSDNGAGMSRADLEACCLRHATSKISSLADLDQIGSLGFRGEALAALSAISDLEISAARGGHAWKLLRGGATFSTQPTTHSVGTTVRVRRLFFNTPARLKFLKSPSAEAARCAKAIRELAVAHPKVHLTFYALAANGELDTELDFPVQPSAKRIAALFREREGDIISVTQSPLPSHVTSFVAHFLKAPLFSRHTKDIFLVVNGRCIEDRRVPFVLREAFGGLIEMGAYPRGAIFLEVDAHAVDVNVHPQKREVRWNKDFPLYSLIYESVKAELARSQPKTPLANLPSEVTPVPILAFEFSPAPAPVTTMSTHIVAPAPRMQFSSLRVVGEIGAAWLVCEAPAGLIIIDQHAAHERVRFDEFLRTKIFPSVPLLIPIRVRVPLGLRGREDALLKEFGRFGFEGTLREGNLEFYSEPKTLRKVDWGQVFDEIYERLDRSESGDALVSKLQNWIASSLACHGSVRRGQRLTQDEIYALLQSLDRVDWNEFCPHGRPTWIALSHTRLEEEFHRI